MKIVVYSAVVGKYDAMLPSHWPMLCFTDAAEHAQGVRCLPLARVEATPARSARWHKVNAHLAVPDADVSVWLDGTLRLRVPPERVVERLGGADVALFAHSVRDCVYEEAFECAEQRKDSRETLLAQVAGYLDEYPPHGGLYETGVLVRRHCDRTATLNAAWWREIETGSHRDQVSFPVVAARVGATVVALPGTVYRDELTRFSWRPHSGSPRRKSA